jgi:predicted TIM-barrel fold metal-dependent hydrolase
MHSPSELNPYLSERWRAHLASFGGRVAQPLQGAIPYPRVTAGNGSRVDSFPPGGGSPGSDLAFMQQQHLDAHGIEFGVLQPLSAGAHQLNLDLGAALCSAVNDWQLEKWISRDNRLKASLCVQQEDPVAAIAEIDRRAADPAFVQIEIKPRTLEPIGRRRYWPIFEAAVAHDLPIGLHSAAYGPHANSGSGWLSYYIEEHYAFAHSLQTAVVSLVMEGVFESFPDLRVVCIEGGFAWVPSLAWRMDKHWERMRAEVPQVKHPPSEYIRDHFWFTTQPIEEPEAMRHLREIIDAIGCDRLMFATDYPHWDFDDPRHAIKIELSGDEEQKIMRDNARAFYKLP